MDPLKIIQKHYSPESKSYHILITHSQMVYEKARQVAKCVSHLSPDLDFIYEACMLHDIGIFLTHAPGLDCHGEKPYICHGYLGREILEEEGLNAHALVCERHTGVGITISDIQKQNLPLPEREMVPRSTEEKIICYADKFYSKNIQHLQREKDIETIKKQLACFGQDKVDTFASWHAEYSLGKL